MDTRRENQETTKQTTQQGGGQPGRQAAGGLSTRQAQQTALSREQPMPTLWASPFSFMSRFGGEMDRLFEDFGFGSALASRKFGQVADWSPQVEVFERDGQLVVRAPLPGLTKDDVQ